MGCLPLRNPAETVQRIAYVLQKPFQPEPSPYPVGFTLVALLSLMLGIGTSIALFNVVYGVVCSRSVGRH